ncbi:MAG: hypothetical protein ACRDHD_04065 [Candidatus Limnocylindria bacterium]
MSGPEAPLPEQAPADRSTEAAPSTVEAASLRDAQAIAARIAADEAEADAERQRLTVEPLPDLTDGEANGRPADALRQAERLHAVRHAALLERGSAELPRGGTLYLTSARLRHLAEDWSHDIPLDQIADMAVALERLLLIGLADGSDLAIEVDRPRLLRVQVAAARAAIRVQPA